MNKLVAPILAASVLTLAGCTQTDMGPEYSTISGRNDQVLSSPAAQGWQAVGISVTSDGTKCFVLKRQKTASQPVDYQYKTVASNNGRQVLDEPANQGWDVAGTTTAPDGREWFLLRKTQAPVKVSLAN